jgi:hypothetical protein
LAIVFIGGFVGVESVFWGKNVYYLLLGPISAVKITSCVDKTGICSGGIEQSRFQEWTNIGPNLAGVPKGLSD